MTEHISTAINPEDESHISEAQLDDWLSVTFGDFNDEVYARQEMHDGSVAVIHATHRGVVSRGLAFLRGQRPQPKIRTINDAISPPYSNTEIH